MAESPKGKYKIPICTIVSPFIHTSQLYTTKRKPSIHIQLRSKENVNILSLLGSSETSLKTISKNSSKNLLVYKKIDHFYKHRLSHITKSVEFTDDTDIKTKQNPVQLPNIQKRLSDYLRSISQCKIKESAPTILDSLVFIMEHYSSVVPDVSKQLTALIEYSKELKNNLAKDTDFKTMQKLTEENLLLKLQIDNANSKLKKIKNIKLIPINCCSTKKIKMPPLDMSKLSEFRKNNSIDFNKEVRDSALNESDIVGKSKFS